MKGISLPVNTIVIIAIAILVLSVLAAFFTGFISGGIITLSLEQAFTKGCDAFMRGYGCDNTDDVESVTVPGYPTKDDLDTTLQDVCADKGLLTNDACARACGCP